jgi:nucleoid-associated protein YgaU
MPRDAKFGLAVGVGLVLVFGVVFFRKETAARSPAPERAATPSAAPRGRLNPAATNLPGGYREHTVEEGDTLMSLATHYYGDAELSSALYRANRDRLLAPDRLPLGAVLRIPDQPRSGE